MSDLKQLILNHFNNGNRHILADLLRFYKSTKVVDASKLFLTDINERELVISHDENRISVPIIPPMDDLNQWKPRLRRMAKQAAAAFGYSSVKVNKYIYPYLCNVLDNGVQLFEIFLLLVSFYPSLTPSFLTFAPPYRWHLTFFTAFTHAIELTLVGVPLLQKYRVEGTAKTCWLASMFVEGFPALNRLKREIARLEAE
jgi:hypothetical protein